MSTDTPVTNIDYWRDRALKAEHALSANRASVPAGWRLVPIEPTQEMVRVAHGAQRHTINVGFAQAYRDMLSAAPEPAGGRVGVPLRARAVNRGDSWAAIVGTGKGSRMLSMAGKSAGDADLMRMLAYGYNLGLDAASQPAQPTAEPATNGFSKTLSLDKRHIAFPVAILEIIRAELAVDLDVMEQEHGVYISDIIGVINNYLSEPAAQPADAKAGDGMCSCKPAIDAKGRPNYLCINVVNKRCRIAAGQPFVEESSGQVSQRNITASGERPTTGESVPEDHAQVEREIARIEDPSTSMLRIWIRFRASVSSWGLM